MFLSLILHLRFEISVLPVQSIFYPHLTPPLKFPQTKEYVIEVKDINGNLIWGGFNESGEISHAPIPKEWTSVQFDFDGSATESLKSGNIYQWKLYSDDSAAPGVQTLLSSSEDLMGLFIVK